MIEKIKELRGQIDGLAQLTKELTFDHNSKQINSAVDSLFLAKAWLGKMLGVLGNPSPYPKDGERKTVADIEPTADKAVSGSSDEWKLKSHIEKVDWLRQNIYKCSDEIVVLFDNIGFMNLDAARIREAITFSNKHLCEARFWLGFELERIREAEKK